MSCRGSFGRREHSRRSRRPKIEDRPALSEAGPTPQQLIVAGSYRLYGYDAATGREVWWIRPGPGKRSPLLSRRLSLSPILWSEPDDDSGRELGLLRVVGFAHDPAAPGIIG